MLPPPSLIFRAHPPRSGTPGVLPPILLGTLTEEGTRSCEGRREERDAEGEGGKDEGGRHGGGREGEARGKKEE